MAVTNDSAPSSLHRPPTPERREESDVMLALRERQALDAQRDVGAEGEFGAVQCSSVQFRTVRRWSELL
jgi:hypothetical protein